MRAAVAVVVALAASLAPTGTAHAHGNHRGCGGYSGRAYVICKESGVENMPDGLPPGAPHRGPSSASGPCGMVRTSRIDYGGDTLAACTRYMKARYGSWQRAEAHHRARNWW